jgi:hypothetical protein
VKVKKLRVTGELAGEWKVLFDAIFVRGMNRGHATQRATAFGAFALEQMPLAGARAQDLARGGNLEPFGHGLFGFDAFWTSHKIN